MPRHVATAIALTGSLIAATGCSGSPVGGGTTTSVATSHAVSDLAGLSVSEARSRLAGLGLQAVVDPVFSSRPTGIVAAQQPVAGTQVAIGGTVRLMVSRGHGIAVPAALHLTQSAAAGLITAHHLRVRVLRDYSSTTPAGVVYQQQPAARSRVAEHSVVVLYVSRGHAPVAVPNVRKVTLAAAEHQLTAAGLRFTVLKAPKRAVVCTPGTVYKTFPHAHKLVPYHSTVRVVPCP